MKKLFFLSFMALVQASSAQITTQKSVIYAQSVKDSFELYISTPAQLDLAQKYDVVYYCDANLKSGKKLRSLLDSEKYRKKASHTLFVGVGHIGNFHVLRRRDFILPELKNGDTIGKSANYGQIERFYQFMKLELIPTIDATYPTNPEHNSILGHSLGGLFAFYCLFKDESLFKNYYALSPALWIDHYKIYKFNHLKKLQTSEKHLYFSAGGLEILNFIKSGAHRMDRYLDRQKYHNLSYTFQIHPWKTHNSQVQESLDYILSGSN